MRRNTDASDKQKVSLAPVISTLLTLLFLPLLTSVALAQQNAPDAGAACAACGGCGLTIVVIVVGIIALHIALLVWVARDAKARSMDSAVLWMILVMVTGVIGLIIFLFSRPQGNLVQCATCQNKRLQASAKCPHCGNP
jgi:uncharacterized BrkB/YihY/UPF0761 family membrane protein